MTKDSKTKDLEQKREYRALLLQLYIEDEKFLAYLITIISTLAIPFFYNILGSSITVKRAFIIALSLLGFGITIILQVIATIVSIRACDNGLSDDKELQKVSVKLFRITRMLNEYRNYCFLLAFGLSIFAITFLAN